MTDLKNIKFEPEVIDDIICLVEYISPKRLNQRKYEENLIKAGYSIGIGEMTETKQMTKQNQPPEIIEIGGVKYQRLEEPKEPKTLHQIFFYEGWTNDACDKFCDTVDKWMSQYTCDYVACREYLNGYNACLKTLKSSLQ